MLGIRIFMLLPLALCFAIAPALAEPMLIAEFGYDSGPQFTPGSVLPSSVDFSFAADVGTPETGAFWQTAHTPNDIGVTLPAPAQVIAGIANAVSNSDVVFRMHVGSQPGGFGGYADLGPPTGNDIGTLTMLLFVSNPTAYRVTSVQRTINDVILQWVPMAEGNYYHTGGKQTVRLYGDLVPEPLTLTLLLLASVQIFISHRSGNTAHH